MRFCLIVFTRITISVNQEFISAGVNAYALGCTDEGLRKELVDLKDSGVEIDAMQTYGGSTSLKSKIGSEEVRHFFLNYKIYSISSISKVFYVKDFGALTVINPQTREYKKTEEDESHPRL